MRSLIDQVVFRVAEEEYRWSDVVLAAVRRGDWSALETLAHEGLLASRYAEVMGLSLDPDEIDAATSAFRRARRLIAGREAEAWLDRWRLEVEDWEESLRRALLRARLADKLASLPDLVDAPSAAALESAVHADGVCSGMLQRFAAELARRAAAHARVRSEVSAPAADGRDDRPIAQPTGAWPAPPSDRAVELLVARGMYGLGAGGWRERLAHVALLDASHERLRRRLLTPMAVRNQIHSRNLDYVRFSCRFLSVPESEVAREAALSLREDGRRMTTLASDVRVVPAHRQLFLDELDPSVRDRFLAASPGAVLGPLQLGAAWLIAVVREKRLPSEDDPDVRRRASNDLVSDALAREVGHRVRWEFPCAEPTG